MLTIKELAAYASYKIDVLVGTEIRDLTAISLDSPFVFISSYKGSRQKLMTHIENVKLLLRPLSQLTQEIEYKGEKFVPSEQLLGELATSDYKIGWHNVYFSFRSDTWAPKGFSYSDYQKLLEWHFDIFGLIERGEAIDLNTIKN